MSMNIHVRFEQLATRRRGNSRYPSRWGMASVIALSLLLVGKLERFATAAPDTPVLLASASQSGAGNAFRLDNATVPVDRIMSGGPKKDGIPALTDPRRSRASRANYLHPEDRVVGVSFRGEQMAYPLRILVWHEVVNDKVGGQEIAVTYCPLCDSITVFDRNIGDGKPIELGVSGLLFDSNVLMYDRRRSNRTESLWSQMQTQSVAGDRVNAFLNTVPYKLTSWQGWVDEHPKTEVLSRMTGHRRNYDENPYEDYFSNNRVMFPMTHTDPRLGNKERVLGIQIGDTIRAYPIGRVHPDQDTINDTIDGHNITVVLSPTREDAYLESTPQGATVINSFWFAWAGFYPDTEIYAGPELAP